MTPVHMEPAVFVALKWLLATRSLSGVCVQAKPRSEERAYVLFEQVIEPGNMLRSALNIEEQWQKYHQSAVQIGCMISLGRLRR